MKIFSYLVFGCVALGAAAVAAPVPGKILTVAADEWCPINCAPGSDRPGIGIELAKRAFEPLGYRVRYITMPWAEALAKARAGKVDAVVGANRNDDPTLIFPVNGISEMSDDFYVLRGNNWRYQGDYTLKGKRIGVVEGYGYGEVVRKAIDANNIIPGAIQAVSGNDALQRNLEKLRTRNIDVLIESKPVMDYNIKSMNLDDEIVWAGGVPQGKVYLAFSPALAQSKERAEQYDAAMRTLRAGKTLEAIYAPYGMQAVQ